MKKIFTFSIVALLLLFAACQPKPAEPVDKEALGQEATAFLDEMYAVYQNRDFDSFASKLNEEGLFLGSDRSEVWTAADMVSMLKEMYKDPDFSFTYKITKRALRISDDGQTILAVEHLGETPIFGPFPVRVTTLLVKSGNSWKVDYMSWGVIPDNEVLFKCIDFLTQVE